MPDTWHVINAGDAVPRGGKFLVLYKRNGHRALVNARGARVLRRLSVCFWAGQGQGQWMS